MDFVDSARPKTDHMERRSRYLSRLNAERAMPQPREDRDISFFQGVYSHRQHLRIELWVVQLLTSSAVLVVLLLPHFGSAPPRLNVLVEAVCLVLGLVWLCVVIAQIAAYVFDRKDVLRITSSGVRYGGETWTWAAIESLCFDPFYRNGGMLCYIRTRGRRSGLRGLFVDERLSPRNAKILANTLADFLHSSGFNPMPRIEIRLP
jgi:hypothetical protein